MKGRLEKGLLADLGLEEATHDLNEMIEREGRSASDSNPGPLSELPWPLLRLATFSLNDEK